MCGIVFEIIKSEENNETDLWRSLIALNAQRLQPIEVAHLIWESANVVVEEKELLEVGQHANLLRELRQFIARQIQVDQLAQLADGGRKSLQLVVVEIKLLEEAIPEQ